jgi:proteasome lid subunit RPN8/RPN11
LSTPFRLLVPRRLYEGMLAQARAELPNECCGFLAGRIEDQLGRAERLYPLVNALASPTRYEADAKSLLHAVRDMRGHDLEVLAIYHSHPTSDPVPSRTDLERSFWPETVYLIISLDKSEPTVRGWWLTETNFRQAEWEIVDQEQV